MTIDVEALFYVLTLIQTEGFNEKPAVVTQDRKYRIDVGFLRSMGLKLQSEKGTLTNLVCLDSVGHKNKICMNQRYPGILLRLLLTTVFILK